MGGLGHHFENAGIASTQISLVRLHTEKIKPPRALWVPFDLGRPIGTADNAAFQLRVVRQALSLLESESGPVLEDFPEDESPTQGETSGWACPINFSKSNEELTGSAAIKAALQSEINTFAPWYQKAVESRNRTTVGLSGLDFPEISTFIAGLFDDPMPESPIADVKFGDAIRLCAEDLKAYFIESASAQPGEASSRQLTDWFWQETETSRVLRQLRERFAESDDQALQILSRVLLVPYSQQ